MQQEEVRIDTDDGLRLEGRLLLPAHPNAAAIVCHPHPLMDGSMSSVLVPLVVRALGSRGIAALRFNFRGVGRSEGRFENGLGEQEDVRAALTFLASRVSDVPLAACGWSFGALVALAAVAGDDAVARFVAIAPPVSIQDELRLPSPPVPERTSTWAVRALAIGGTRDDYCRPDDLRAWADATLGDRMRVEVVEGADHAFTGTTDRMTSLLADAVVA